MSYYEYYPLELVARLLAHLNPCELMIYVNDEAVRHFVRDDLPRLVREYAPHDGIHAAYGNRPGSAFVVDVDNDRTCFRIECTCSAERHDICDNCWVTMAGSLQAYIYVMRSQYCCKHLLACYSGNRGFHLFVLDAEHVDRTQAMALLLTLIPDTLLIVARKFITLATQNTVPTLEMFDPRHSTHIGTIVDDTVIRLFLEVLFPYFEQQWVPRVMGANADSDSALHALRSQLDDHVPEVIREAIAKCYQTYLYASPAVQLHNRIDVFLIVVSTLWRKPDPQVAHKRHMLRIPFSRHARSGNFSLPIRPEHAPMLRPQTRPPRADDVGTPGTIAHTLFSQALGIVTDLLEACERSPRSDIWPAHGRMFL